MLAQSEGGVTNAIASLRTRIVPKTPEFAHCFRCGRKYAQDVLVLLKAEKPVEPFVQKPIANLFECRFEVASIFADGPNVRRSALVDQPLTKRALIARFDSPLQLALRFIWQQEATFSFDVCDAVLVRNVKQEAPQVHGEGECRATNDRRLMRVEGLKVNNVNPIRVVSPCGPGREVRESAVLESGPDA